MNRAQKGHLRTYSLHQRHERYLGADNIIRVESIEWLRYRREYLDKFVFESLGAVRMPFAFNELKAENYLF